MPRTTQRMRQQRLIGIVGGLGPFAHLDFERKLLEAARELTGATADQDFPEWVLSSIPQTPDRTEAFLGHAEDPSPVLLRSLERVRRAGADFAVVACNTAHLFLEPGWRGTAPAANQSMGPSSGAWMTPGWRGTAPAANQSMGPSSGAWMTPGWRGPASPANQSVRPSSGARMAPLREESPLPILSLVEVTADEAERIAPGGRVGLLATSGTLRSRLYHDPLEARGLRAVSPLDLEDGEALQLRAVMEAIYGPWVNGRHRGGGIKTDGGSPRARVLLEEAAGRLVGDAGVDVLVAGCTEIPLALGGAEAAGRPLFDPARLLAAAAIRHAYNL